MEKDLEKNMRKMEKKKEEVVEIKKKEIMWKM